MMQGTANDRPLQKATEALSDLISAGTRIGLDLLGSLGRLPMPELPNVMGMLPRLGRTGCCSCDIPTPCWAPQSLGELTSHVCPGGTATLRIRVTNCGTTSRKIQFEATGPTPGITITPNTLTLGPMERGVAVATLSVDAAVACGVELEALIWVRGCQDHFMRWTVKVSERGVDACHQIDVEDCPDLIHHWYDHFYCDRPCLHRDRAQHG